ncbi:MAG: maleate cis-trans isomerase family protein, partial [Nitrososphaerales archaeon]
FDVIAQAGTPFIFLKGPAFEDETRDRLKKITSTPVIFMAESVVKALKHLGVKKPNVESTYYDDEFNSKYKAYLEFHGFEIPKISGIPEARNLHAGGELNEFPTAEIYRQAKKLHHDSPDADGLVISGGGIMSLEILDALEKDLGVPVISSNQALYWYALDTLDIKEPIRGSGSLLESLAFSPNRKTSGQ